MVKYKILSLLNTSSEFDRIDPIDKIPRASAKNLSTSKNHGSLGSEVSVTEICKSARILSALFARSFEKWFWALQFLKD